MSNGPFLRLVAARVVADGAPLCDDLSIELTGPRAVVVGYAEPLLGPLLRRAHVERGTFEVLGSPLDEIEPSRIGLVPLDPLLPPSMTPLDYVAWSARLAGVHPRQAAPLAARCCDTVGLGAWAARPLGALHATFRRLTVLAQALVTEPALLVVEAPLAGLDPQAAAYLLQAIGRASAGRPALLSAPASTPDDDPLLTGADQRVSLEAPAA